MEVLARRELDLGLLGGLLEPLQRHRVPGQVDALVALELGDEPVDQDLVEVVAPRCVSPLVAFTSKTPSPISRIEMS